MYLDEVENTVIIRYYTKNSSIYYDTRIDGCDIYKKGRKNTSTFFKNEAIKYCLGGFFEKNGSEMFGYWRICGTRTPKLSKIVRFSLKGCSCGHKGISWCRHEKAFQWIKFYMSSNGVFEPMISLHVMKYLV